MVEEAQRQKTKFSEKDKLLSLHRKLKKAKDDKTKLEIYKELDDIYKKERKMVKVRGKFKGGLMVAPKRAKRGY